MGQLVDNPVRLLHRLRGKELVSAEALQEGLRSMRPDWDPGIQIGPLTLLGEDAVKHICFVGSPGSGKTVLMRQLMQSVLPQVGRTWKGAVSEQDALRLVEEARQREIAEAERLREAQAQEALLAEAKKADRTLAEETAEKEMLVEAEEQPPETDLKPIGTLTSAAMGIGILLIPVGLGLMVLQFIGMAVCGYYNINQISLLGATLSTDFLYSIHTFSWTLGLVPAGIGLMLLAVWMDKVSETLKRWGERLMRPIPTPEEAVAADEQEQDAASEELVEEPSAEPQDYRGPFAWEKHRALVYDAKLEVLPQLAGMGLNARTVVFNPFDVRSVAWDMAADITEPAIAQQIAAIFIPEEKNASQPFFSNAARKLLEGVMVAFILTRPGEWTFRDVLVALKSHQRLRSVLLQVPETADLVETYLSNDKEAASIIATLGSKLGPYEVVASLWEAAGEKVSLRDWLDSEDILVLANDESYRSSLDVINRVIFKRVVELLLAQPATTHGRTWFFLDEVKEAGNLDGLGRLMTKGRSFGASVVLGFQDVHGLYDAFGENQAKSILGQCATKVFLRLDSTDTAKWAESVFGEYEAVEAKQSTTGGESMTQGLTHTVGSSSTDTTSRTDARSTSSDGRLPYSTGSGSNSSYGTSEATTSSDSQATSQSDTTNRSDTISSEIVKRHLVLASELESLPMTRAETGLHGFVAHHEGAARFVQRDFLRALRPDDANVPRVIYRPPAQQYLKPWTEGELARNTSGMKVQASGAPAAAQSAQAVNPSSPLERTREASPEENAAFAERLSRFRGQSR